MKLDQLVKLYGRREDVAELAALRDLADDTQKALDISVAVLKEATDRAVSMTARAEAAEAKIAAALEVEAQHEIETSWECRGHMVGILRGEPK